MRRIRVACHQGVRSPAVPDDYHELTGKWGRLAGIRTYLKRQMSLSTSYQGAYVSLRSRECYLKFNLLKSASLHGNREDATVRGTKHSAIHSGNTERQQHHSVFQKRSNTAWNKPTYILLRPYH